VYKRQIENISEGMGKFTNREDVMIGNDVIVTIHKTNNDGNEDLYNMVGKVTDVNENGTYLVRMMNGELYTFEKNQVIPCPKVVGVNESTNQSWEAYKEKKMAVESEFDGILTKWFGKVSGNDMRDIFKKSYQKLFGE